MAAGNILLQANDSKVANIVFEDGASGNMSVTVPKEGGTLANEAYVSTAINTVLGNVSTTELGYLDGVTSAIQTQMNTKQTALVSGTDIKTINGTSLLGSGNVAISTGSSTAYGDIGTYITAATDTLGTGQSLTFDAIVGGNTLWANNTSAATTLNGGLSASPSGTATPISVPTGGINLGLTGTWRLMSRLSRGPTATSTSPVGLFVRIA